MSLKRQPEGGRYCYTHWAVRYLVVLIAFGVLATGCHKAPDGYPPPEQRPPLDPVEPAPAMGRFVRMDDSNADEYVVKDVNPREKASTWRWTLRRPELRFYIQSAKGLRFFMDFVVPEATFRETGPVTLAILINGQMFTKIRCVKPDRLYFDMPVPGSFLKEYGMNSVVIEPDKVWVSKEDGVALGFILTSVGFVL